MKIKHLYQKKGRTAHTIAEDQTNCTACSASEKETRERGRDRSVIVRVCVCLCSTKTLYFGYIWNYFSSEKRFIRSSIFVLFGFVLFCLLHFNQSTAAFCLLAHFLRRFFCCFDFMESMIIFINNTLLIFMESEYMQNFKKCLKEKINWLRDARRKAKMILIIRFFAVRCAIIVRFIGSRIVCFLRFT